MGSDAWEPVPKFLPVMTSCVPPLVLTSVTLTPPTDKLEITGPSYTNLVARMLDSCADAVPEVLKLSCRLNEVASWFQAGRVHRACEISTVQRE